MGRGKEDVKEGQLAHPLTFGNVSLGSLQVDGKETLGTIAIYKKERTKAREMEF